MCAWCGSSAHQGQESVRAPEQVVVIGCWGLNHALCRKKKALLIAEPNPYILNFLNEVTYYCVYVCAWRVSVCVPGHVWNSEDNFVESGLSLQLYLVSGDQA